TPRVFTSAGIAYSNLRPCGQGASADAACCGVSVLVDRCIRFPIEVGARRARAAGAWTPACQAIEQSRTVGSGPTSPTSPASTSMLLCAIGAVVVQQRLDVVAAVTWYQG